MPKNVKRNVVGWWARINPIAAVKMEFAVKAPYAGKVAKILVEEGQQLSPGMKLVELESNG